MFDFVFVYVADDRKYMRIEVRAVQIATFQNLRDIDPVDKVGLLILFIDSDVFGLTLILQLLLGLALIELPLPADHKEESLGVFLVDC